MQKMVAEVIAEYLAVDIGDVTPKTHLKDTLGADSLDLIEIFNELEDETGKSFDKDQIRGASTLDDIVEMLGGSHGDD
jgi:acyl carrier protein